MRDRPHGAVLLEQARAALLRDLLELLPESRRLDARMIANAMAIAKRELAAGDRDLMAERAALAAFYQEHPERDPQAAQAESLGEALERLNWKLASEIRGGLLDGNAEAFAILRQEVTARLRNASPKLLDSAKVE
jgi:hypothetical protein